MLPNEVFALERRAYYESIGLVVDATNGEFAHCPYPEGMGESGYYLLHDDHQHQGILQSKDLGQCCFFVGHAKKWLLTCEMFPGNYFELWDIYEMYTSVHQSDAGKKGGKVSARELHKEKDERGRSKHAVKCLGKVHDEKDEFGRSVQGVRNAKKLNERKDELGRSVNAMKGLEKLNAEKDSKGRSLNAMKMISQVWESEIDGFRSGASQVASHNRANSWDPNARRRVY